MRDAARGRRERRLSLQSSVNGVRSGAGLWARPASGRVSSCVCSSSIGWESTEVSVCAPVFAQRRYTRTEQTSHRGLLAGKYGGRDSTEGASWRAKCT